VDLETLEVLARNGIRFTILTQYQAARFRKIGARKWLPVPESGVDPGRVYRLNLPSGNSIDLFFYHGPVARAVAFENLLDSGDVFANRLQDAFPDHRDEPILAHIATDGETYGHHHRFGEMALAYALQSIETNGFARLTNYGEFLEIAPPTYEVEILENTSWSCSHGIGRWREDCGCNTGGKPGWNQKWRKPLRKALDDMRDSIIPSFEMRAGELFNDPWNVRDEYIELVLDRSPECVGRFLDRHALHHLTGDDRLTALGLLELQRHAMLMYTSCGWFFNDLSGIESIQVLQYAARAMQLGRRILGKDGEPDFLGTLEAAESNDPERGNGRRIFEESVRPAVVDLHRVGARCVVNALFKEWEETSRVHAYLVETDMYRRFGAGKAVMILQRMRITHSITGESEYLSGCALHLGDHNLVAGVKVWPGDDAHKALNGAIEDAFSSANLPEALRIMDRHFQGSTYSLDSLFLDERRAILDRILETTLEDVASVYRRLYQQHAPLIRFLRDMDAPLPGPLSSTAEYVHNADLRAAFSVDDPNPVTIRRILHRIAIDGVSLDTPSMQIAARQWMDSVASRFRENPDLEKALASFLEAAGLARELPFDVNFKGARDLYYSLLRRIRNGDYRPPSGQTEWGERFARLGRILGFEPENPQDPGSPSGAGS